MRVGNGTTAVPAISRPEVETRTQSWVPKRIHSLLNARKTRARSHLGICTIFDVKSLRNSLSQYDCPDAPSQLEM